MLKKKLKKVVKKFGNIKALIVPLRSQNKRKVFITKQQ